MKKKNFEDLQKLADQVADKYPGDRREMPEAQASEPIKAESDGEILASQEKARLLLEAEQMLKRDMEEFQKKRRWYSGGYRLVAFFLVFCGFAPVFLSMAEESVPLPMKFVVLAGVFAIGLFSARRKRS